MSDTDARLSREDRIALKSLCTPSDRQGLPQLAGHFTLIALAGFGVWQTRQVGGWGAALPMQLLLGIALTFLFAPAHETVHRTAFRSRWLNDAVASLAGAVLILPPHYFRAFHLEHHRHTQIPGKDPELAGKTIAGWGDYAWHLTGLPYWRAAISGLFLRAVGRSGEGFLTGRIHATVQREAQLFLLFYAGLIGLSVATGSIVILTYWVIPMLLGQPFLRLYLLAEHGLCPMVADMFRNTRTTLTNRVVRWLAWNMPYHAEHHAFMAVPFHRLPEVHARFRDRIEVQTSGYLAFHRHLIQDLRSRRALG